MPTDQLWCHTCIHFWFIATGLWCYMCDPSTHMYIGLVLRVQPVHYLGWGGGLEDSLKNNMVLPLAKKNNLVQPVCWKKFFALICCKKMNLVFNSENKKNLASTLKIKKIFKKKLDLWKKFGFKWCVKKKSSFISTEENNLLEESLPTPPPIMKWLLPKPFSHWYQYLWLFIHNIWHIIICFQCILSCMITNCCVFSHLICYVVYMQQIGCAWLFPFSLSVSHIAAFCILFSLTASQDHRQNGPLTGCWHQQFLEWSWSWPWS